MKRLNSIIVLILVLQIFSLNAVITVKQDGSGDYVNIQDGINSAVEGDTVLVYPGIYYENIMIENHGITLCSLELIINNPSYIDSTIIDGQRAGSCIITQYVESTVNIQGFTIRNGFGTELTSRIGGGFQVQCVGNLNIFNCNIANNIACTGGAIFVDLTELFLSNVTIYDNSAALGGGIYLEYGSVVTFDDVQRCNIYNNNAGSGADIFAKSTDNIHVIVDTFTVQNPDSFFAHGIYGSTLSFDINHAKIDLIPHDLYVSTNGDDNNSGLSNSSPLKTLAYAVRIIDSNEQNPRSIFVESGTYSWEDNQQIFPIGGKKGLSIIGEDMYQTILKNDIATSLISASFINGTFEIKNFNLKNSVPFLADGIIISREIDTLSVSNIVIDGNSNLKCIVFNEYVHNIFDSLFILNNDTYINSGLLLAENSGVLRNSIFRNNRLVEDAIHSQMSPLLIDATDHFLIENCEISNCISEDEQGYTVAITAGEYDYADILISNCLFASNETNQDFVMNIGWNANTTISNCTFVNNQANLTTIESNSDLCIVNTIFDNDMPYEVFMSDRSNYGIINELNIDYSVLDDGQDKIFNESDANTIIWGSSNIIDDPNFLLSEEIPYQLSDVSPCIDTGTLNLPDDIELADFDLAGNPRIYGETIDMGCYEWQGTDVSEDVVDNSFNLKNYPNPFNPITTIAFNLPEDSRVTIDVYNIKGQKVKELCSDFYPKGTHSVIWDGENESGYEVSSGIYYCKLKSGNLESLRKMILIK